MNICFLLGGFTNIGGIGRVTSTLANKFSELDNKKVHTLSLYNTGESNHYLLNERINQSFLFDKPVNMKEAFLKGATNKLNLFLKKNKIDILIACGSLYFPLAIAGTFKNTTKVICWEHSHLNNNTDHPFQRLSRRVGIKYADALVTLTESDMKNYINKFQTNKIININNPIDEKIIQSKKSYRSDSKKIISVGRLTEVKNFDGLIEIANEVLNRYKEWTWDIYGDGELRVELENKIRQYGLTGRLNLKGSVEDIYDLYPEYSFLVMTSKNEGFGMVLLEGLANGLPLVSYDIEVGPREIIINGENGFLVQPFLQEEMVSKVSLLINQESIRKRMSDSSLIYRKNYSMKKVIDDWERLFTSID